ncbi:O-antigen/teichoic acid export membrane protein [Bacillus tianshenii]|uniref:O-antigen/teichoic acid export membrane protein n=1 Tax=Sutcliffiella tianshenii TaxID=1463404 RepID=A0ABS2NV91_9BACI|nr:O-antigen/teichoic acid export membrane protein [Bacillus tianshenii]
MRRLIQNYIYNLGYQFLTIIIPFITIPYVTRVLGPDNIGIEAFTLSIVSIFVAFASGGTSVYATRMVASLRGEREKLSKEVYNLFFIRSTIAFFVIVLFLFIASNSVYKEFLLLQLVYLLAFTILDVTWYFAGKERFKEITIRNALVKIVGFAFILLFVNDTGDLDVFILINGLTLFIPNIYFIIKFFIEVGKPKLEYFSMRNSLKIIKSLIPFFVLAVIIQVYMNVDRLIIESKNLTYELGIYSQYIKTFGVFLAPITAIGTILMPFVTNLNHSREEKKDYQKVIKISTNFIFLLGLPIFFGVLITSNKFVSFYFGSDFLQYNEIFKLGSFLIITGCLSNVIIQQVIFPNKLEFIYIQGLIIASLLRVLIIYVFINKYNIYAAMIAYIISELALLIWCILKSKKTINLVPILFCLNNSKILFSSLVMSLSIYFFDLNFFFSIFIGVITYLIIIILIKEELTYKIIKLKLSKS